MRQIGEQSYRLATMARMRTLRLRPKPALGSGLSDPPFRPGDQLKQLLHDPWCCPGLGSTVPSERAEQRPNITGTLFSSAC
jgi:hypothetical protein